MEGFIMTVDTIILKIFPVAHGSVWSQWIDIMTNRQTEVKQYQAKIVSTKQFDTTAKPNFQRDKKLKDSKFYANGKFSLKSSGYRITWRYNHERMSLELNMSIPKIVYDNNVMPFKFDDISHHAYSYKSEDDEQTYNLVMSVIYQVLRTITFNRFKREHFKMVQITRIDLSRNMFFRTNEERNSYFEVLRHRRKSYQRKDAERIYGKGSEKETIFFKSTDYSVKFYKKDLEIEKNLKKEFLQYHSVSTYDELLELAKICLRFEVTLRNAKIAQLFNQHILDMPSEHEAYKRVYDWRLFSENEEYLNLSHENNEKVLNYAVFQLLNYYCEDIYEEFILTEAPKTENFEILLEEYKAKNPKFRIGNLRLIYKLINEQGKTWDEVVKMGWFSSKNTKKNIENRFKIIGLNINQLTRETVETPIDYSNYYNLYNQSIKLQQITQKNKNNYL